MLIISANGSNASRATFGPPTEVSAAVEDRSRRMGERESYVDFVPDPRAGTVVGTDAPENIVVLRSPSKFWGIAATRVGVAWCVDRARLCDLLGRRETWPISGIDVVLAEAAMGSVEWAERARLDLARDAAWLAGVLRELPGKLVEQDVGVHYRCLICEHADAIAARMAAHGVGARALGRAHGADPGALRVLAPLPSQRDVVARAVQAALHSCTPPRTAPGRPAGARRAAARRSLSAA